MSTICTTAGAAIFMAALMVLMAALEAQKARAVVEVDITRGQLRAIPIAIPEFFGESGGDREIGRQITNIIVSDLTNSGLFKAVDPASFIERLQGVNARPRFGDWRMIKAEALAVGAVQRRGGRVEAQFRLWDVYGGRQLAGERFAAETGNLRRIGHLIADAIYQRMTGEKGYFDTRVVFIDETGPKSRRVKRLAIMDQDGHNVRTLSSGEDLVLTPRFSPTRQEITFMSYAGGRPRVYLMNIESGRKKVVGEFPGMTFSPRFSPRGDAIAMSLQVNDATNLFELDLRSRRTRQLTKGRAIDTSPSYSPDGRQIAFESDRSGNQQIYVMPARGGAARRVSRGQGRYSTPVWSPRGDLIAFTKQVSGRFLIGVMRTDGTGERILTSGFHNEGPTWAPNGRVLMFFRAARGAGGPKLFSVDLTGRNERPIPTPSFASDPAWSPLVN